MAAKTNVTRYSIGTNISDILYPQASECMSLARGVDGILNLIIPFDYLHKGLSEEDVYKWVELGNSSIFKASIRKGFSFLTTKYSVVNEKLKADSFEVVRKNISSYERRDAQNVLSGKILSLAGNVNAPTSILLNIIEVDPQKNKPSYAKKGQCWSVSTNDFEFKDKSIKGSVTKYIAGKIKEVEDTRPNDGEEICSIISIDGCTN